jgi:hypothetical protein
VSKNNKRELVKERFGIFIIASALVWGAVIVGTSIILKGTGQYERLMPLLSAGAGMSIIILPMLLVRKKDEKNDAEA